MFDKHTINSYYILNNINYKNHNMSYYGGWPKGFKISKDWNTYIPKSVNRSKWRKSYDLYRDKVKNALQNKTKVKLQYRQLMKMYERLLAANPPKQRGRPKGSKDRAKRKPRRAGPRAAPKNDPHRIVVHNGRHYQYGIPVPNMDN